MEICTLLAKCSHCFINDWDNAGARALTFDLLARMLHLTNKYELDQYVVEISPGNKGSISIVWEHKNAYLFLDYYLNNKVHIYYKVNDLPKYEKVLTHTNIELLKHIEFCSNEFKKYQ